MVVHAVDLVISARSCCVGYAGPEPVRVLPHEVIIEPIFKRAQDDDGSGEFEVDLLDRFVRKNRHCSGQVLPASEKKKIVLIRLVLKALMVKTV